MNIPKNIQAYQKSLDAYRKSLNILEQSKNNLVGVNDKLSASFQLLNGQQQASILVKIQSSNAIQGQKNAVINHLLSLTKLDEKQKENILTTLEGISAKNLDASATKKATDEIANQLGTKQGSATGMMWAMAATATIMSAMNTFSQSKQAQSVGEALGSSIGSGITSALSGAMMGFMVGGVIGAIIGGIGSLAVSGISGLVGYTLGAEQRAIDSAGELSNEYRNIQKTIDDNTKVARGYAEEYERLSRGVDRNGRNVSLTADEYARYKEIVTDLANKYPELTAGHNAEGTAILNLAGNVTQLTKALEDLAIAQTKAAAQDYIDNKAAGIIKGANASISRVTDDLLSLQNYTLEAKNFFMSFFADYDAETNSYVTILTSSKDELIAYNNVLYEVARNLLVLRIPSNTDTSIADFISRIVGNLDFHELGLDNVNKIDNYIRDNIITPITNPNNTKQVQEAISGLFTIDINEESASEYDKKIKEYIQSLPKEIREILSRDDNRVLIKLGIDIGSVENIMNDIQDQIASHRAIVYVRIDGDAKNISVMQKRLKDNLNIDELRMAHRIISSIEDKTEKINVMESISSIFDDKELISNVRSIQQNYRDSKVSIIEANDAIEQSFRDVFGESAPEVLETFLNIFRIVPQTIYSLADNTADKLKNVLGEFDKLQSAIDKLKNGEPLTNKDIIDLIENGQIKLSDIVVDKEGFMSVPIEAFQNGIDKIHTDWNIFIDNQKAGIQEALTENQRAYDEDLIDYSEYLNNKYHLQKQYNQADYLGNINFESNIAILNQLKSVLDDIQNAYNILSNATEEYNEHGYITVDTLKKVLELGDDYLHLLYTENKQLKFNKDALEALAYAQLDELEIAALRKHLDLLSSLKNEEIATNYLNSATGSLKDALAELNNEMANTLSGMIATGEISEDVAEKWLKQADAVRAAFAAARTGIGKESLRSSSSNKFTPIDKLFDTSNLYLEQLSDIEKKLLESEAIIANLQSELSRVQAFGDENAIKRYNDLIIKEKEKQISIYQELAEEAQEFQNKIKDTFKEFASVNISDFGIAQFKQKLANQIIQLDNQIARTENQSAKRSLELQRQGLQQQQNRFNEYEAAIKRANELEIKYQGQIQSLQDEIYIHRLKQSDDISNKTIEVLEKVYEKTSDEIALRAALIRLSKDENISLTQKLKILEKIADLDMGDYNRRIADIDYTDSFVPDTDFDTRIQNISEKVSAAWEHINFLMLKGYKDTSDTVKKLYQDIFGYEQAIFDLTAKRHEANINNLEHELYLYQQNNADDFDYGTIVNYYKQLQASLHALANERRAYLTTLSLSAEEIEADDYIESLQKKWWDLNEQIKNIWTDYSQSMIRAFELEYDKTNDIIALNKSLLELYNDENLSLKDRAEILEVINNLEDRAYQRAKNRIEHEILLHRQNTSNAVGGAYDTKKVIEYYRTLQEEAHKAAQSLRKDLSAEGWDSSAIEADPRIQQYQRDWWNYFDSIHNEITNKYDRWITEQRNAIEILELDDTDKREIISHWQTVLNAIELELEQFSGKTDDFSKRRVEALTKDMRDIRQIMAQTLDNIVRDATAALDGITGLYNNLLNAAQEFADSGFITVDQFKQIISAGVEYLHLLEDENGQLVINEENIKRIAAARTEQLAVETAMNYIYNIQQALRENEIAKLNELVYGTQIASNSTWDLVYANVELAKTMGLTDDAYERVINNLNNLRSIQDSAISGIGRMTKELENMRKESERVRMAELREQERALNDLLRYVMDMIRWETGFRIEGLREQIRAFEELINLRKQELREMQRKRDFEKGMERQTKDLAKLQSELARLQLDNSGDPAIKARRMQLAEQIQDMQGRIDEDINKKYVEEQEKAYDEDLKLFKETKEQQIRVLEDTISSTEKLYRLAIDRISLQWETLFDDLIHWNYVAGNTIERDLVMAWDLASLAVQRYGSYLEALLQTQEQINTLTNSMNSSMPGSGDMNRPLTVANTGNFDTAPSSAAMQQVNEQFKQTTARDIVNQMQKNSLAWHTANSTEQQRLADANQYLANELSLLIGRKVIRNPSSGHWYLDGIGQERLYEATKFHTGGIVGQNPTPKEKEVLSLLEKKEAVLTENQKENMIAAVDNLKLIKLNFEDIFKTSNGSNINISDFFEQIKMPHLINDMLRGVTQGITNQSREIINNNSESAPIHIEKIEVPVIVRQKIEKSDIGELGKEIADVAMGAIINSRREQHGFNKGSAMQRI